MFNADNTNSKWDFCEGTGLSSLQRQNTLPLCEITEIYTVHVDANPKVYLKNGQVLLGQIFQNYTRRSH